MPNCVIKILAFCNCRLHRIFFEQFSRHIAFWHYAKCHKCHLVFGQIFMLEYVKCDHLNRNVKAHGIQKLLTGSLCLQVTFDHPFESMACAKLIKSLFFATYNAHNVFDAYIFAHLGKSFFFYISG